MQGMAMRVLFGLMLALAALGLVVGDADAATKAAKREPYFASIQAGRARMRTGPGRSYPASWLYQRADLPVKIIDSYGDWRKIEDPDGTQGWMLANLISTQRTAMVMGEVVQLLDAPRYGGKLQWRAAPGVVGRISQCARGWCYFDIRGRGGFVQADRLWGVDPDETLN
jgi:SH3-like domain-containing protein